MQFLFSLFRFRCYVWRRSRKNQPFVRWDSKNFSKCSARRMSKERWTSACTFLWRARVTIFIKSDFQLFGSCYFQVFLLLLQTPPRRPSPNLLPNLSRLNYCRLYFVFGHIFQTNFLFFLRPLTTKRFAHPKQSNQTHESHKTPKEAQQYVKFVLFSPKLTECKVCSLLVRYCHKQGGSSLTLV